MHPNTCLQAIIAGRILDALNQRYATAITPLTSGEILNLIGADPLQPYWDWVSTNALSAGGMGDDPDLDGLVNLGEFVFDLDPDSSSPLPLTLETSGSTIAATYWPDPDRERLVEVVPEWSADLAGWEPVPATRVTTEFGGGVHVELPSGEAARFVRLQLRVRSVN